MRRNRLTALALAGVLAVTACSADNGTAKGKDGVIDPGEIQLVAALEPFGACDEFLAWVKDEANERVGPYGLDGVGGPWFGRDAVLVEDAAAPAGEVAKASVQNSAASGSGASSGYSSTNTVEVGVDEADIVKTDGKRIVTISQNKLRVVDPSNGAPKELGSLELDEFWGSTLFLAGDKALVLGQVGMAWRDGKLEVLDPNTGGRPDDIYVAGTKLTEVDLSNPANPKVVRTLTAEGNLVNSRMVGDTARIVVQSTPSKFEFLFPQGPQSEDRAEKNNREVIAESTVDQWLPSFVLSDGGTSTSGRLVPCEGVHHPSTFSGFSITSVLTVDLGGKLTPGDGVAVLADGQRVYASPDNLYVSVNRFEEPEEPTEGTGDQGANSGRIAPVPFPTGDYETAIHKFSIKGGAPAKYLASGTVRGHLMNDFSLSEHNGNLRVATTDGPPWGAIPVDVVVEADGTASSDDSDNSDDDQTPAEDVPESFVTVLGEKGGELTQLGQVGGLGKGERIYGVRFLGEVGYVVTFRQVDPLYTLDLSNPAQPTVKGELKILGYSAYLHPLPDGRLLGVGADATEEGRRTGVQVSVFDVSDLANPRRTSQVTLPDGFSDAEYDYKAFLYWEKTGLVTIPVSTWSWDPATGNPTDDAFTGMLGFDVEGDQVAEKGRISHPDIQPDCGIVPTDQGKGAPTQPEQICPPYKPQVIRSMVIGTQLYTFSESGLGVNDLASLAQSGFLTWS